MTKYHPKTGDLVTHASDQLIHLVALDETNMKPGLTWCRLTINWEAERGDAHPFRSSRAVDGAVLTCLACISRVS